MMGMDLYRKWQVTDSLNNLIFIYAIQQNKIIFFNDSIAHEVCELLSKKEYSEQWQDSLNLNVLENHSFPIELPGKGNIEVKAHALSSDEGMRCIMFTINAPDSAQPSIEKKINELKKEMELVSGKKNEFIDHAAHDLNSPIRKLSVFIEKLEALNPGDQSGFIMGRIKENLSKMKSIVDDFTELARSNRGLFKVEDVDLGKIITGLVEEMKEEIETRNAEVKNTALPTLEGDGSQLKELFKNLLENAIKFGRQGQENIISFSTEELTREDRMQPGIETDRKYHKIIVEDRGIGFDSKYSTIIFEPFRKVHSIAGVPGNGLGLAISMTIAKNHGGTMIAQSNGDSGSRFVLILPESQNQHS